MSNTRLVARELDRDALEHVVGGEDDSAAQKHFLIGLGVGLGAYALNEWERHHADTTLIGKLETAAMRIATRKVR
jgi:hypothetical protein